MSELENEIRRQDEQELRRRLAREPARSYPEPIASLIQDFLRRGLRPEGLFPKEGEQLPNCWRLFDYAGKGADRNPYLLLMTDGLLCVRDEESWRPIPRRFYGSVAGGVIALDDGSLFMALRKELAKKVRAARHGPP